MVSSYAFHHCNEEEKKLAIREMDRVLRDRGTVIIADLMFANGPARKAFEATCSKAEREDLEDEYFANVDDVSEIFTMLGYKCEAEQVDELIWVICAGKE